MFDAFELNEGGVDARIRKIMNRVIMEEYQDKAEFLNLLVSCLDEMDELDSFGTEGWRKRFDF